MTGLNHVTTGIAIAITLRRPEFALPLSLLSHFVLDSVPHSKVPLSRKTVFRLYLSIEALAMTTITIACMLAFPSMWLLVGICAVLAFLPDFFWPFYYNGMLRDRPFFKHFYAFHTLIQWSETYRGWAVEVLYFSVLVIYLSSLL